VKFRRRFATPGRLSGLFTALRDRLAPSRPPSDHDRGSAPDALPPGDPETIPTERLVRLPPEEVPDLDELLDAQAPKTATESGVWARWAQWARWATRWHWPFNRRLSFQVAGVFGGMLLFGYLFAAIVLFPAPIFASHRSIPRVLGQEEAKARETLTAAGFGVGDVEREPHPTAPVGTVIWQDPPAEVVAPEATDVSLILSSGPQRIPVPDVAGYDAEQARSLIEGAGLRVGSTESTQAPTPKNVAVNTRPPAGTTLNPGTSVVLVVSVGAATLRVPTLTGLSIEEARLALETGGLALGTAFEQTTTAVAPGEVFFQEPAAGTLSAPGTVVNVRIARSPR
jgi:beta-lactam-binding protein with PASTA domain